METKKQLIRELYEENIFELSEHLHKLKLINDVYGIKKIGKYLKQQTEIVFDAEALHNDLIPLNEHIINLMSIIPVQNNIKTITIRNSSIKKRLKFTGAIEPNTLNCINIKIGRLCIVTENITTLSVRKIQHNKYVIKLIQACEKLKILHIESETADELKLEKLYDLKLNSLKFTGKYVSKFSPVYPLRDFLISQAPHLCKLSVKIKNRPDLLLKLELNRMEFSKLKKLKYCTCDKFCSRTNLTIPNSIENLKIKMKFLSHKNFINTLNWYEQNQMLKSIIFINSKYEFPINTQIHLINKFCSNNNTIEIKFKQKQ